MLMLRTTRSGTDRRTARRAGQGMAATLAMVLGLGVVLIGILGCGGESRDAAAPVADSDATPYRPLMTMLPPPKSDWIDYSAKDRKLTFYDLPASGQWMVKPSDATEAYSVGPDYTVPEGLDPTEMLVYYMRPGGQTSRPVTLAQIQSARPEHVSILR